MAGESHTHCLAQIHRLALARARLLYPIGCNYQSTPTEYNNKPKQTKTKKQALNPHPRGAIQFALTKPEHYLPEVAAEVPEPVPTSSRNKRKSAKKPVVARKAEADTVVLFRLYSECGRLINLHDLFVAFEAAVTDEGAPNPPAAAELRGRFLRGMAELQWLGFVKPTSAKTDHVIRLTWGSLASN